MIANNMIHAPNVSGEDVNSIDIIKAMVSDARIKIIICGRKRPLQKSKLCVQLVH